MNKKNYTFSVPFQCHLESHIATLTDVYWLHVCIHVQDNLMKTLQVHLESPISGNWIVRISRSGENVDSERFHIKATCHGDGWNYSHFTRHKW